MKRMWTPWWRHAGCRGNGACIALRSRATSQKDREVTLPASSHLVRRGASKLDGGGGRRGFEGAGGGGRNCGSSSEALRKRATATALQIWWDGGMVGWRAHAARVGWRAHAAMVAVGNSASRQSRAV